VKLMIAIGAFVGASNWLILFLITAILGGILAVCLLLIRGGLVRALKNVLFILGELVRLRLPISERSRIGYHSSPRGNPSPRRLHCSWDPGVLVTGNSSSIIVMTVLGQVPIVLWTRSR
jgi:hypothetical protein